jgi:hypothetical protein
MKKQKLFRVIIMFMSSALLFWACASAKAIESGAGPAGNSSAVHGLRFMKLDGAGDEKNFVNMDATLLNANISGNNLLKPFGRENEKIELVFPVSQKTNEWIAQAGQGAGPELGARFLAEETMPDGKSRGVIRFSHDGSKEMHNAGIYYRLKLEGIPGDGQYYYINTWLRIAGGTLNRNAANSDIRTGIYQTASTGVARADVRVKWPLNEIKPTNNWTECKFIVFVPKTADGNFFEFRLYIPNGNAVIEFDMASVEMYKASLIR